MFPEKKKNKNKKLESQTLKGKAGALKPVGVEKPGHLQSLVNLALVYSVWANHYKNPKKNGNRSSHGKWVRLDQPPAPLLGDERIGRQPAQVVCPPEKIQPLVVSMYKQLKRGLPSCVCI